jgi:hypothetical protein
LAPVLIRLAWHSSGTYNAADNTGGSNYATMRFKPEASHGANNGLVSSTSLLFPKLRVFSPDNPDVHSFVPLIRESLETTWRRSRRSSLGSRMETCGLSVVSVPSRSLLDLLYLGGPVELTDTTTTALPMVGCRTLPRLRTTCETFSTGWGESRRGVPFKHSV